MNQPPSPTYVVPGPARAARRIGLMGGSFDPVHRAHVAMAHVALAHLQLDEVRWIPVGHPWQKARQLASAAHRLAMVRLATEGEPRFVVDDIELRRPGPSYTVDTVKALQQAEGDEQAAHWFLIIGQDQYANLPTWLGWQDLVRRVTLAVAARNSQPLQAPSLLRQTPHAVVELPLPPLDVSSTDIRARLSAGQDACSLGAGLVPDAVARYIADHQLYAPGHPPLNGHP